MGFFLIVLVFVLSIYVATDLAFDFFVSKDGASDSIVWKMYDVLFGDNPKKYDTTNAWLALGVGGGIAILLAVAVGLFVNCVPCDKKGQLAEPIVINLEGIKSATESS